MSPEGAPRPIVARPLFDPETVPHDPGFFDPAVRGAAVADEHLVPGALQRRFAAPPAWQPEIRADARLFDPSAAPRDAAVLMPLIARGDDVAVLLTQRTAHLYDHAGQISFPGGRVEPADIDAVATALRESEEEIGLNSALVQVLGVLPQYLTATGYRVTPVVGLVEQPFVLTLDDFEVAEAFEVPLRFLMDPRHHERRVVTSGDGARTFYSMPYQHARRYFIWGATAAMLRNLYHLLRA